MGAWVKNSDRERRLAAALRENLRRRKAAARSAAAEPFSLDEHASAGGILGSATPPKSLLSSEGAVEGDARLDKSKDAPIDDGECGASSAKPDH